MDRREGDREKPKGKSASINNQVTPVARITTEGCRRVWNCLVESLTFKTPRKV